MRPSPRWPRPSSDVGGQRQDPVAELDSWRSGRGARAISAASCGVPPHVVGVDDDADGLGRELRGQVEGLAEPGEDAPVRAEHRVQRLDAQPDPRPARRTGPARRSRRRSSGGPAPGPCCPAPVRRTPGPARRRRARRPRPRPPVVGRAAARGVRVGVVKNPPRHRLDTCRPAARTAAAGSGQAELGDLVPPQADAGMPCRDAQVDGLPGTQVLHRGLVEREPAQPVAA